MLQTPLKTSDNAYERRCVVNGTCHSKDRLLRFVRSPEGVAIPDVIQKSPGRGAYICINRETVDRLAKHNKVFERAFRAPTSLPDDWRFQAHKTARRAVLQRLGLARRSGDLVLGGEKVQSALAAGKIALMVLATDGADKSLENIKHKMGGLPFIQAYSSDELAMATGRARVVQAGITSPVVSQNLLSVQLCADVLAV